MLAIDVLGAEGHELAHSATGRRAALMDASHAKTSAPVRGELGRGRSYIPAMTDRSESLDHDEDNMAAGVVNAQVPKPGPCPQCGHSIPGGCRCPGAAGVLGLGASLLFLVAFWWSMGLVLRWLWE